MVKTDPESECKLSGEISALPKTKKRKKMVAWSDKTMSLWLISACFPSKTLQGGSFVLFLSLQLCMEQLRVLI